MENIKERPSAASGAFAIGGDLPAFRLGFGAMRLTGDGVWGPPKDEENVESAKIRLSQDEFEEIRRAADV